LAGAELKDVLQFAPDQGPAVFQLGSEDVKKPMRALEKLGIPVVAALEGTALGGGWEISLCAHLPHRAGRSVHPARTAGK